MNIIQLVFYYDLPSYYPMFILHSPIYSPMINSHLYRSQSLFSMSENANPEELFIAFLNEREIVCFYMTILYRSTPPITFVEYYKYTPSQSFCDLLLLKLLLIMLDWQNCPIYGG